MEISFPGGPMRRVLTAILLVLLLAIPILPIAKADTDSVIDARFLKIKIVVDGKPVSNMVVNLTVNYDEENNYKWVRWDSVFIMSDQQAGRERVFLRPDHYETGVIPNTGRIRNIIVSKNRVTFDLIRSIERIVHIVCVKRGEDDYDLRGKCTYNGSNPGKKTVTEEWVLTDTLTLPSKEVFGYPERAKKAPKKKEAPKKRK